jgi:hypothetical protein
MIFCICVFLASSFSIALMKMLSLYRLVSGSDTIVKGRVESIHCEWSLDKRLIYTVLSVQVQEVFKGEFIGNTAIIQIPGGTVEDLSLAVSDMPEFETDETILVFLNTIKNAANLKNSSTVAQGFFPSFKVFGRSQGKFKINFENMASRRGYTILSKNEVQVESLPLHELKTRIQAILRQDSDEKKIGHESRH